MRSNRVVDLFGKRLTLGEEHTHQYVTAVIKVRAKQVTVVTIDGQIVHDGSFAISRVLRRKRNDVLRSLTRGDRNDVLRAKTLSERASDRRASRGAIWSS